MSSGHQSIYKLQLISCNMYSVTNRRILDELRKLPFLRREGFVGSNTFGSTNVSSLGKFYSKTLQQEVHLALKEYDILTGNTLCLHVACELGLIDLVEKNFPGLVPEFPLFHGVLLDQKGFAIGVITEDYSKNNSLRVSDGLSDSMLPYEIQQLMGKPKSSSDLATTSFLVNGKRRIGDFGAFTEGTIDEKFILAGSYWKNKKPYCIKTRIES